MPLFPAPFYSSPSWASSACGLHGLDRLPPILRLFPCPPGVSPREAITKAPDFPADFAWLNTDQPLSFKANLKGQVVVMDFWCYCCINCMHVLPDLEYPRKKIRGSTGRDPRRPFQQI